MKVKRLAALLLAGLMIFTLAACQTAEPEVMPPVVEDTPAPEPVPEPPAPLPASIDFEDGNMDFVMMYTGPVRADPSELALVSYNGSTALEVTNVEGNIPFIAIDLSSILGDDIIKVASVEMTIGTAYAGGGFSASSGLIRAWVGADRAEVSDAWSVYLANQNPKVAVASAFDGRFVAGADNILIVTLDNDVGPEEGNGNATVYIDDIRFLDGAGNVVMGDTSVAFNPPEGFIREVVEGGLDMNLFYLTDAHEISGFSGQSGDGWSQAYVDLTDEERAMFVPGSVLEIAYNSAEPVWPGYNGEKGWLRGFVDQEIDYKAAYVSSGNNVAQWTYEYLQEAWGEDFADSFGNMFVEAWYDWEVVSVRVGMAQNISALGNAVDVAGFTGIAGGGWSQGYVALSDDEKALLVPGAVIEVAYISAEPIWLGYNGENGWIRAIDDSIYDYTVMELGEGVIQVSYELLEEFWGEGWVDSINELFIEAWNDWEVISLTIGTPLAKGKGLASEVTGFSGISGEGWSQGYVALTDEEKELLGPGSFINVYYISAAPVWVGYNGENGWIRAIDDSIYDYTVMTAVDGMVQISYDTLVSFWGEGFTDTINELFVEAWNNWEILGLYIGVGN